MSYNLLMDTGFNDINKHWTTTNCSYKDGFLCATDSVFSIEQNIILPTPTKLYLSFDYIAFDKNIKNIYVGIQIDSVLESTIKKPHFNKRCRISVVSATENCNIKIKLIVESDNVDSKLYIDSPLLIDLNENGKSFWSKPILDKVLDYRYGFNYTNLYNQAEFGLNNEDLLRSNLTLAKGVCGVVLSVKDDVIADLTFDGKLGHFYVAKLDYKLANDYGKINLKFGEQESEFLSEEQQCLIFKFNGSNSLKLEIKNSEILPYIVNLRHLLIIDVTDLNIEFADIEHMPYI